MWVKFCSSFLDIDLPLEILRLVIIHSSSSKLLKFAYLLVVVLLYYELYWHNYDHLMVG